MAYIEWNDYLVLGIDRIDDQHHKLVEIINKLYQGILDDYSQKILSETLDELLKYSDEHFKDEEELFVLFPYLQNDDHVLKHNEFTQKIIDHQKILAEGGEGLSMDMLGFLTGWLTDHIQVMDKEYTTHLKHLKEFKAL